MLSSQPLPPSQICPLLHSWIESYYEIGGDDLIINELGFYNKDENSSVDHAFRADVVLASNRLIGFEIKSEKDSLKRWHAQMIAYPNVFDETWLCVHAKHLDAAIKITANHIGILLLSESDCLSVVRAASKDVSNNIYDLSGLLWKDELIDLAKLNDIPVKSSMRKREIKSLLVDYLSLRQVGDFVLHRLKVRKSPEAI